MGTEAQIRSRSPSIKINYHYLQGLTVNESIQIVNINILDIL